MKSKGTTLHAQKRKRAPISKTKPEVVNTDVESVQWQDDTREYLKILFIFKGNFELYGKIFLFVERRLKINAPSIDQSAIHLISRYYVDQLFDILLMCKIFHQQPEKVMAYIQVYLGSQSISFAEFFRGLILIGLSDDRRFEENSDGLKFIRRNIAQMKMSEVCEDKSISSEWRINLQELKRETWWKLFGSEASEDKIVVEGAVIRGITKTLADELKELETMFSPDALINKMKSIYGLDVPERRYTLANKVEKTTDEIAVFHAYEDTPITKHNAEDYAEGKSPHKLYLRFNHFRKRKNRLFKEASGKILDNKIEMFERVLPRLSPGDRQQQATDEIEILKQTLKKEWPTYNIGK